MEQQTSTSQATATTPWTDTCPSCDQGGVQAFYEARQVPVHSVLLLPTREEALGYTKGDVVLGFCRSCGFVYNMAFDPSLHEYSEKYEETQGFSPTFQTFHRDLAARLIERHNLRNKTIIEIGCGKGEFLTTLCEMGENRGVGFDPAYISERNTSPAKDQIIFVRDFYSEKYTSTHGDVVICKMTLEHIPRVLDFMRTVRRSIGEQRKSLVFFQIPDLWRILEERAFWDVYYEHCSYFTEGSLSRLFKRAGFTVLRTRREYDNQYLTIEALPGDVVPVPETESAEDVRTTEHMIRLFAEDVQRTIDRWKDRVRTLYAEGKRLVIWGAGSKGVAFLTKTGITSEILYAVDINPHKEGTFMAGTGQQIVLPHFLAEYRPHTVIVMNPIYCGEIRSDLEKLGIQAEILPITA